MHQSKLLDRIEIDMNDKTNVFVFDKKELALIFIFMILIAITSFAIGVKIGKGVGLHLAGVHSQDQDKVRFKLKSMAEEKMEQVLNSAHTAQNLSNENKQQTADKTYQKLEEEFQKINGQITSGDGVNNNGTTHAVGPARIPGSVEGEHHKAEQAIPNAMRDEQTGREHSPGQALESTTNRTSSNSIENDLQSPGTNANTNSANANTNSNSNQNSTSNNNSSTTVISPKGVTAGNYTIQLGSYPQEADAIKFADGFRIRGYNPILSEVRIPDKGIWYRVSLGTFTTVAQAKEYISKEESLFQGQDYVITEFN